MTTLRLPRRSFLRGAALGGAAIATTGATIMNAATGTAVTPIAPAIGTGERINAVTIAAGTARRGVTITVIGGAATTCPERIIRAATSCTTITHIT